MLKFSSVEVSEKMNTTISGKKKDNVFGIQRWPYSNVQIKKKTRKPKLDSKEAKRKWNGGRIRIIPYDDILEKWGFKRV